VSTWVEDFNYSLDTLDAPHPGDLGAEEVYELIEALVEGASEEATVAEILGAGAPEVIAAAGALKASWYVGVLIGACLYASAKQAWEPLTAPIDLEKISELAKQYDAPILELPVSEEVSWYPATTVAHEPAPPAAPEYPRHVVKRNSTDTDSVA
jgi:hypothetical protein